MSSCAHTNKVKTAAGNFCMDCGQIVTASAPKPPAAKATASASVTGAKKTSVKASDPKPSIASRLIKNFHKTPAIEKPKAKPIAKAESKTLSPKKTTKIKVDSVSTPLLQHGKPPIEPISK